MKIQLNQCNGWLIPVLLHMNSPLVDATTPVAVAGTLHKYDESTNTITSAFTVTSSLPKWRMIPDKERPEINLTEVSNEYSSPMISRIYNHTSEVGHMAEMISTKSSSELYVTTSLPTLTLVNTGIVLSSLETAGHVTSQPFNTAIVPTGSQSIQPLSTGPGIVAIKPVTSSSMTSNNIFTPLAEGAIPSNINARKDHPIPRLGIVNRSYPLQTNKFYANFFLGSRTSGTWTHPYSIAWVNGGGVSGSRGLSISHIDRDQIAYGPGQPASFFINPIGIQSMIFSAKELGNETTLTSDRLTAFSVQINLATNATSQPSIMFPLVQGMGFVTAVYNAATPLLQSGVFFKNLTYGGVVAGQTVRYEVELCDGKTWLVYMTPFANQNTPQLTMVNNGMILGSHLFSGCIQIAKIPVGNIVARNLYDASAGVYPTDGAISGRVENGSASYTLSWTKVGVMKRTLLMYALPHHIQSFSPGTISKAHEKVQLATTTKGMAIAVTADSWTMFENDLPNDMGFAPWSPQTGSLTKIPQAAVSLIHSISAVELAGDMNAQTNLNSMYYAGKGLAKFAFTIYAAGAFGNNTGAASAGLAKLKACFARFVNNSQIYPLVYDEAWHGVVSVTTYLDGGLLDDFGNTAYNDHHFHYGYFVYAAAVIAYLDPHWLTTGNNKAWVTTLIRDYANPSTTDRYFPFSRNFDWFHGHSWAHGLFESADGKDQESSSEDGLASYALKMWGYVTGDANMEARGNLMLAVQARSFRNYYLMQTNNIVQPPSFIGNRVAGILFENKIDHTTYFGNNISFIEGIHMLPLNPSSALTRPAAFVREEWSTYFSNDRVDQVASGGWRGICYANLALVQPKVAWKFFASGLGESQKETKSTNANSQWSNEWLDGGASRTWYLTWAAAFGGAD